ncbi:MAG: hypothetical protein CVU65_17715 [Deltaproteobacteria bacterium HGW-Deltaproteobacteria-22]|jgi:hypothetical protein|nr:MAG: hypothetical protein CVU65_17715 [Deltaproteobacteria bacterium HGW-Deltaproteobacteria-22]
MSKIRTSYYSRRDKVVAAQELIRRIKEKWADEPPMMYLVTLLEPVVRRMAEGYGGLDTRPATEAIRIAEEDRDNADQSAYFFLRSLMLSKAHADRWEAASQLLEVLAPEGMNWIYDSYASQSLRTQEVLARFSGMGPQIEKCQARVFVDQMIATQATFEQKLTDRGEVVAEKPEILVKVTPEFERTLRAALMLIERRPEDSARTFVLEPFTRLQRKSAGSPSDPAPAPQA